MRLKFIGIIIVLIFIISIFSSLALASKAYDLDDIKRIEQAAERQEQERIERDWGDFGKRDLSTKIDNEAWMINKGYKKVGNNLVPTKELLEKAEKEGWKWWGTHFEPQKGVTPTTPEPMLDDPSLREMQTIYYNYDMAGFDWDWDLDVEEGNEGMDRGGSFDYDRYQLRQDVDDKGEVTNTEAFKNTETQETLMVTTKSINNPDGSTTVVRTEQIVVWEPQEGNNYGWESRGFPSVSSTNIDSEGNDVLKQIGVITPEGIETLGIFVKGEYVSMEEIEEALGPEPEEPSFAESSYDEDDPDVLDDFEIDEEESEAGKGAKEVLGKGKDVKVTNVEKFAGDLGELGVLSPEDKPESELTDEEYEEALKGFDANIWTPVGEGVPDASHEFTISAAPAFSQEDLEFMEKENQDTIDRADELGLSDKEVSNLWKDKANIKIEQRDLKNARLALGNSLKFDPNNQEALNLRQLVEVNCLKNGRAMLTNDLSSHLRGLDNKMSVGEGGNLLKDFGVLVEDSGDIILNFNIGSLGRDVETSAAKISDMQLGLTVIGQVITNEKISVEEFSQLDETERSLAIARTFGVEMNEFGKQMSPEHLADNPLDPAAWDLEDLQKIQIFSDATFSAEDHPDVQLLIAGGNTGFSPETPKDFTWKTGEGIDPDLQKKLETNVWDNVRNELNLKNLGAIALGHGVGNYVVKPLMSNVAASTTMHTVTSTLKTSKVTAWAFKSRTVYRWLGGKTTEKIVFPILKGVGEEAGEEVMAFLTGVGIEGELFFGAAGVADVGGALIDIPTTPNAGSFVVLEGGDILQEITLKSDIDVVNFEGSFATKEGVKELGDHVFELPNGQKFVTNIEGADLPTEIGGQKVLGSSTPEEVFSTVEITPEQATFNPAVQRELWKGDQLELTFNEPGGVNGPSQIGLRKGELVDAIDVKHTIYDANGHPVKTVVGKGDKLTISRTLKVDSDTAKHIIENREVIAQGLHDAGGDFDIYKNQLLSEGYNLESALQSTWEDGYHAMPTSYSTHFQLRPSESTEFVTLRVTAEVPAEKVIKVGGDFDNPIIPEGIDLESGNAFEYGYVNPESLEAEVTFFKIDPDQIKNIEVMPLADGTPVDLGVSFTPVEELSSTKVLVQVSDTQTSPGILTRVKNVFKEETHRLFTDNGGWITNPFDSKTPDIDVDISTNLDNLDYDRHFTETFRTKPATNPHMNPSELQDWKAHVALKNPGKANEVIKVIDDIAVKKYGMQVDFVGDMQIYGKNSLGAGNQLEVGKFGTIHKGSGQSVEEFTQILKEVDQGLTAQGIVNLEDGGSVINGRGIGSSGNLYYRFEGDVDGLYTPSGETVKLAHKGQMVDMNIDEIVQIADTKMPGKYAPEWKLGNDEIELAAKNLEMNIEPFSDMEVRVDHQLDELADVAPSTYKPLVTKSKANFDNLKKAYHSDPEINKLIGQSTPETGPFSDFEEDLYTGEIPVDRDLSFEGAYEEMDIISSRNNGFIGEYRAEDQKALVQIIESKANAGESFNYKFALSHLDEDSGLKLYVKDVLESKGLL